MNKSTTYIFDKVPLTDKGLTREQEDIKQKVLLFMRGDCPNDVKKAFVERILELEKKDAGIGWIVGFIPAPNITDTIMRYGDLALTIGEQTNSKAYLDLFREGKSGSDSEFLVNSKYVENQNVILIDAILTTGTRYRLFRNKVKNAGAKSVYGIIVGKTNIL